eukprot:gene2234-2754_t
MKLPPVITKPIFDHGSVLYNLEKFKTNIDGDKKVNTTHQDPKLPKIYTGWRNPQPTSAPQSEYNCFWGVCLHQDCICIKSYPYKWKNIEKMIKFQNVKYFIPSAIKSNNSGLQEDFQLDLSNNSGYIFNSDGDLFTSTVISYKRTSPRVDIHLTPLAQDKDIYEAKMTIYPNSQTVIQNPKPSYKDILVEFPSTLDIRYQRDDLFSSQSSPTIQFSFNNQTTACLNSSNPCDWFDPSIWIGGQVPTVNSDVEFFYTSEYNPIPQFYITSSQTISVNSLRLLNRFSISVIQPGTTLNITSSLLLLSSQLEIANIQSDIGSIVLNINSTLTISNSSSTIITGNINTDNISTISFNNTYIQFFGDNNQFNTPIYAYQTNNLQFLGYLVSFSGLYSSDQTNLAVNNLLSDKNGLILGSLTVNQSATFTSGTSTFFQGILTTVGANVTLIDGASVVVAGHFISYISRLSSSFSSTITFINSTSVIIDSVLGQDKSFELFIDNCDEAIIGNDNSPYVNTFRSIGLSARSSVTLHGINDIGVLYHQTSFSGSTLPESIQLDINNLTTIHNRSYLMNATVTVMKSTQLSFGDGFVIYQNGGIIVQENGSLTMLSIQTDLFSNYQVGTSGLILQDGSTLNCQIVNITGDIYASGNNSVINSHLVSIYGDVYLNGGSSLNVIATSNSTNPYFKSYSIQRGDDDPFISVAEINVSFYPSPIIFVLSDMIETMKGSNISNTIINIYLNGSSSENMNYIKGETLTIWKSLSDKILGEYQKKVLDSSSVSGEQEFKKLYYSLSDNGYTISIKFGKSSLAPWKIGVIVAASIFVFIIVIVLLIVLIKRLNKSRKKSQYSQIN